MTVIMKIDLVGPKSRGLAVGLNEFAGYFAVGATAFVTGYIAAATHALRPEPFYIGIAYSVLGLALSVLVIRDTSEHVRLEADEQPKVDACQLPRSIHADLLPRSQLCSPLARPGW